MICDKRTENHNFTITTIYEPACGILSLLDISSILAAHRHLKEVVGEKISGFYDN